MNPPHREASKTVVPLKIGVHRGIPPHQSPESPHVYWQYVPQSGTQSTPPEPTTSTKNEARGPDEIDRMIFCLVAGIFLPAAISFSQSHSASGWYFVAAIMVSAPQLLLPAQELFDYCTPSLD